MAANDNPTNAEYLEAAKTALALVDAQLRGDDEGAMVLLDEGQDGSLILAYLRMVCAEMIKAGVRGGDPHAFVDRFRQQAIKRYGGDPS